MEISAEEKPVVLVTNSDWETATHAAGPWLSDLARRFREKWPTVELHNVQDVWSNYVENFEVGTTSLHFGCGHGNSRIYTGYSNSIVLWCNYPTPKGDHIDQAEIRGAIHYLLSCLTGQELGPWLVENGARAYIGWKKTYKLMISNPADPMNDPYVKATVWPGLAGLEELLNERTVADAENRIRAEMEKAYNEWKEKNPMVAAVIAWNLDGLTVLGDKSAKLPEPSPPPTPPQPPEEGEWILEGEIEIPSIVGGPAEQRRYGIWGWISKTFKIPLVADFKTPPIKGRIRGVLKRRKEEG